MKCEKQHRNLMVNLFSLSEKWNVVLPLLRIYKVYFVIFIL